VFNLLAKQTPRYRTDVVDCTEVARLLLHDHRGVLGIGVPAALPPKEVVWNVYNGHERMAVSGTTLRVSTLSTRDTTTF